MDAKLGIALGLVMGLVGGWLARDAITFGTNAAPSAALPEDRPAASAPSLAGSPRSASMSTPGTASAPVLEASLTDVLSKGSLSDLYGIRAKDPKPTLDAAAVDALVQRLDAAVRAGDSKLFTVVVALLAIARAPRGDAALLAVVADHDVELRQPLGGRVAAALVGSKTAGLAAAARSRIEKNAQEGETSWTAVAGGFDLVATAGAEADVEWMLSFSARHKQWRMQAMDALAKAGRREGAGAPRALFDAGYLNDRGFAEVSKNDPDAAAAIIEQLMLGNIAVRSLSLEDALSAFASRAPDARLPQVELWIRALSSDEQRIGAARAIESLRERGRDVLGLSAVADAPVLFIDRVGAGELITELNRPLLEKARDAIEYNPGTWSERAATALERAAAALDRAGITVGGPDYRDVAKRVRAGLKSQWK